MNTSVEASPQRIEQETTDRTRVPLWRRLRWREAGIALGRDLAIRVAVAVALLALVRALAYAAQLP